MSEVKRYTFDEICESQDFNHEETFILASDYEKLKAQLERAEATLKLYADSAIYQTIFVSHPYDDLDSSDFDLIEEFEIGEPGNLGEKAREYFKEKEQV